MDYEAIITKLIGKIAPVGETNTDNDRFDNLRSMCDLIERLILEVHYVCKDNDGAPEYSRKRAAEYAEKSLRSVKDELTENCY